MRHKVIYLSLKTVTKNKQYGQVYNTAFKYYRCMEENQTYF